MLTRRPEFKLISCTKDPVETLFAVWVQSRPTQYRELLEYIRNTSDYRGVVTPVYIKHAIRNGQLSLESVSEVFKRVSAMSIPVTESIHFTWGFTNLPIEWREQAVRKRQWGLWVTSMREFGMDDFVTDGRWTPPVRGAISPEAELYLSNFMDEIEAAYNKLKSMGVPQEIARKIVPLCASHNGAMFSNFRTLLDTLSSRSCWIAQIDLWSPVLRGIVDSLKRIDPLLGMIISPPCFDRYSNEFKGCKYKLINQNRLSGKDPYAPCPLYCYHEPEAEPSASESLVRPTGRHWLSLMENAKVAPEYISQGHRLLPIWSDIWQRDPYTGCLR